MGSAQTWWIGHSQDPCIPSCLCVSPLSQPYPFMFLLLLKKIKNMSWITLVNSLKIWQPNGTRNKTLDLTQKASVFLVFQALKESIWKTKWGILNINVLSGQQCCSNDTNIKCQMPSREFYSVCTLTSQHRERILVSLYFVSLCAGLCGVIHVWACLNI